MKTQKDKRTYSMKKNIQDRKDKLSTEKQFDIETRNYLRQLPYNNLKLTKSCHNLFINLVNEVQLSAWNDPEIADWAIKVLEEEKEQYDRELEQCYRRLGRKTKDTPVINDIPWPVERD